MDLQVSGAGSDVPLPRRRRTSRSA